MKYSEHIKKQLLIARGERARIIRSIRRDNHKILLEKQKPHSMVVGFVMEARERSYKELKENRKLTVDLLEKLYELKPVPQHTEYSIISSNDVYQLTVNVSTKLSEGWVVQGGISTMNNTFFQALTRTVKQ